MGNVVQLPTQKKDFIYQGNVGPFGSFLIRHFEDLSRPRMVQRIRQIRPKSRIWKRKHIRIPAQFPFHLTIQSGIKNQSFVDQTMGKTINLSESGALLETVIPIPENCSLILTLALEDQLIECEVKWIHQRREGRWYQTGVMFLNLEKTSQMILKQFINTFRIKEKLERKRTINQIYMRELAGMASSTLLKISH